MTQNEDDAVQRHRDMHMVMLTNSIESTERLVEVKMKMYDRMGVEGSETTSSRGCIDKNIRKNISPKLNFEVWKL